jgi:hypothetical protein
MSSHIILIVVMKLGSVLLASETAQEFDQVWKGC